QSAEVSVAEIDRRRRRGRARANAVKPKQVAKRARDLGRRTTKLNIGQAQIVHVAVILDAQRAADVAAGDVHVVERDGSHGQVANARAVIADATKLDTDLLAGVGSGVAGECQAREAGVAVVPEEGDVAGSAAAGGAVAAEGR